MNAFETAYQNAEANVEAGILHFGTLCSLIRERIMRIDEMTRPLATFAPVAMHDDLLIEREALIARLLAVKAKHA